jgi:hypothetical protein
MGALRELLAKLDIEVTGAEKVHEAGGALESFKGGAERLAKFFAAGAIIEGVKSMVEGLEEQAVQLSKTSQILGINTQDLQAWQYAAKQSGVDAEAFAGGVKKLEINAGKAAEAGAATGGEFAKLGVNLREDAGGPMRDVQEILHDTGMAIARLPDPMTRADAVMKTFGKSGSALIPLFNKGEAGLKDMLDEIDSLGGGISEQAIGRLEEMHQATNKWDTAMTSAKSAIAVELLPAITSMLSGFTKGVVSILHNKVAMEGLKSVVITLGAVGAVAGLEFIAPWIPAIAAFVLLAAVVDEFRVGMAGGKTVIGDVLDQLFGKGAGQSFFVHVKQDVLDLIEEIKKLVKEIEEIAHTVSSAYSHIQAGHRSDNPEENFQNVLAQSTADAEEARDKDLAARGVGDDSHNAAVGSLTQAEIELIKDNLSRGDKGDRVSVGAQIDIGKTQLEDLKKVFSSSELSAIAKQDSDFAARLGSVSVPGGEKGAKGPTNVTQSNNTTVNITAPKGDPSDIADATGTAIQEANRANLAAVQTFTAKP